MRKKGTIAAAIVALVLVLGLGTLFIHGVGDTIDGTTARALPDHYGVKERAFFKWGDTFDVSQDGVTYGTITQKLLNWTKTFQYDDNTGATSAVASVAVFSWGTQIDVVDAHHNKIGTIKEEVFSSFLKTWSTYKILDANGKQVATSQKSEFFSTSFDLTGNDGHVIAIVHRPAFNWFGDNWDVTIKDNSTVDPRLEIVIAAFKTSADNDKKKADDDKKHKDDDKSSSSKH